MCTFKNNIVIALRILFLEFTASPNDALPAQTLLAMNLSRPLTVPENVDFAHLVKVLKEFRIAKDGVQLVKMLAWEIASKERPFALPALLNVNWLN